MRRFTITEDHIKLARKMWVSWDYMEFGAPCIDPKRPYGNSDVIGDIHEILTGENFYALDFYALEDDLDPEDFDTMRDELYDKYSEVHREMQTVIQIALRTGSFEPGVYEAGDYTRDWRRIDG